MQATSHQQTQINKTLELIRKYAPELVEMEGDTKWTEGKIVFKFEDYEEQGDYVFMIGPLKNNVTTFHLMPLYGVKEISEKHGEALKEFEAGKSCINFKNYDDLPEEVLIEVIEKGTPLFKDVYENLKAKKK